MVKTLQFNICKRTLLCLLCLVLFLSCVSLPFKVQATSTAVVAIGAYGVTKLVISAKVLVGLIVGSFAGFLLEPLLEETDVWYEQDTAVRNWADQYNGRITGGEVITIPSEVQDSIKFRYKVPYSVDLSMLYVPYDLLHLEKVSAVHIFGQDVAAQLESNNALLYKSNSLLAEINTTLSNDLYSLRTSIEDSILTMNSSLLNVRDNIISSYTFMRDTLLPTLNTNIVNTYVYMRDTLVPTLNNSIVNLHTMLRYNVEVLNGNIVNTYIQIRDNISAKLVSIDSRLTTLTDTIVTSINTRLDVIIESLATTANPPPFETPSVSSDNLTGSVSGGKGAFALLLGQAMDLISRYRTAFLAIGLLISKLLSVGFVGDLVVFGLALGLFGLIVDLASQYLKAGSSSSAKSSKKSSTKNKRG